jgi:hypothetical protein
MCQERSLSQLAPLLLTDHFFRDHFIQKHTNTIQNKKTSEPCDRQKAAPAGKRVELLLSPLLPRPQRTKI